MFFNCKYYIRNKKKFLRIKININNYVSVKIFILYIYSKTHKKKNLNTIYNGTQSYVSCTKAKKIQNN